MDMERKQKKGFFAFLKPIFHHSSTPIFRDLFRYSCDSVLYNFFTQYSIIPVLQYSNRLTEEVGPMAGLTQLAQAMADLDKKHVIALVESKLKGGILPLQIVEELNDGMIEIGHRFTACEYYISELMYSSHIYKEVLTTLEPLLGQSEFEKNAGTIVIGTVKGDIHDIGKNIVITLLRNAGFKTIDLGVDVATDKFVETAKETGAKVLALSCLLNFAIQEMKNVVEALTAAKIRGQVKVIIGGQPIDEKICEYVGADYYGADAPAGIRICKEIYTQK